MVDTKQCPTCGDTMSLRCEAIDFKTQLKADRDSFEWFECHFCHTRVSRDGVCVQPRELNWEKGK